MPAPSLGSSPRVCEGMDVGSSSGRVAFVGIKMCLPPLCIELDPKAPFTLELMLRAWRRNLLIGELGAFNACLFTPIHFAYELSTWELEGFSRPTYNAQIVPLMDPMWALSQWGFKHSLACYECFFIYYHSLLDLSLWVWLLYTCLNYNFELEDSSSS